MKCKCKNCKKEFHLKPSAIKRGRGNFCCKLCQYEYKKNISRVDCVCENCGKIFNVIISIFISGRARHCSRKCSIENIKQPKGELSYKYSQIKIKCMNCENEFKIKKYRQKNAKYCSRKCRFEYEQGSQSPLWNGTTEERLLGRGRKEYSMWRLSVFERDDFVCQKCGYKKGHILNAHHIYNFSSNREERYKIINGITLCKYCHNKFHKIYGTILNNKKQLIEYLEITYYRLNKILNKN